jgi:hypothetical protein
MVKTSDLPQEVQEQFEIVGTLEGGPRFDLPAQKMIGVDFTQLTLQQARLLVRRNFAHLKEKAATSKKV